MRPSRSGIALVALRLCPPGSGVVHSAARGYVPSAMNASPPVIDLSARFEDLGRALGEREAAYARDLETARGPAEALRIRVEKAATP